MLRAAVFAAAGALAAYTVERRISQHNQAPAQTKPAAAAQQIRQAMAPKNRCGAPQPTQPKRAASRLAAARPAAWGGRRVPRLVLRGIQIPNAPPRRAREMSTTAQTPPRKNNPAAPSHGTDSACSSPACPRLPPPPRSAFVFIKPHAVTPKVEDLVSSTLAAKGITILKQVRRVGGWVGGQPPPGGARGVARETGGPLRAARPLPPAGRARGARGATGGGTARARCVCVGGALRAARRAGEGCLLAGAQLQPPAAPLSPTLCSPRAAAARAPPHRPRAPVCVARGARPVQQAGRRARRGEGGRGRTHTQASGATSRADTRPPLTLLGAACLSSVS